MRRVLVGGALAALLALAVPHAASAAGPRTPGWTVDRVRIEPLDPAAAVAAGGIGEYRGVLEVGPSPSTGGVAVLNELPVDDYLRGLAEVPSTWPLEAQKAQAVAARSYLLSQVASRVPTAARAAGAHICATDACQVYAGLAKERAPAGENWVRAVAETSGQVLLHRGVPIVAKYSSSNGGVTVGGGRPYLRGGVADPFDAASPLHRWRAAYPLDTVRSALGLSARLVSVERVGDRVELRTAGDDGTTATTSLPAVEFRATMVRAVPPPEGLPQPIPSMRYALSTDGASGTAVVSGGGWGHGIGMSQWGAYGRAVRGWKAADILAAYYAGLRPVALPPERLPSRVRVAVDLGRSAVTVAAGGAFRVLDGQGRVLAHAASGVWTVAAAGRGVRVVPPRGQGGLEVATAVVPEVVPGREVPFKVTVSAPSVVRIELAPPGAPARSLDLGLVVTEREIVLPAAATPGGYRALVIADAGGGRVAEVVHDFPALDPAPPAVVPPTSPVAASQALPAGAGEAEDVPAALAAFAAAALAAVATGGVRVGRRR